MKNAQESFLGKPSYLKLFLVLLVLGGLSWFIVVQYQKIRTVTFVIPPGTAQQLANGEEVISFPNDLTFVVGDTIVIDNQDDAVHTFGPFTILPHTTLTKRFNTAKVYQNSCTFHQGRQMTLVVNPASWAIIQ